MGPENRDQIQIRGDVDRVDVGQQKETETKSAKGHRLIVFCAATNCRMMRMLNLKGIDSLLITGTNGFVGRSIIDKIASLSQENLPNKLILVTRKGANFELSPKLREITKVLQIDLTQTWNTDVNVSHVINLAADGSENSYSQQANAMFTKIIENLILMIRSQSENVRLFHASSGACFGIKPINPVGHSFNPKAEFIKNRIFAEENLRASSVAMDFELIIGRLFTFSGTHILRKNQYAITDFINSALNSGKIYINGDPGTVRSYLHQDAMATWILKSLSSPHTDMVYQIGSSDAVTLKDLAEFIADETSSILTYSDKPNQGDVYLPDNQFTRTTLGVEEGMGWRSAVKEMIFAKRVE